MYLNRGLYADWLLFSSIKSFIWDMSKLNKVLTNTRLTNDWHGVALLITKPKKAWGKLSFLGIFSPLSSALPKTPIIKGVVFLKIRCLNNYMQLFFKPTKKITDSSKITFSTCSLWASPPKHTTLLWFFFFNTPFQGV